VEDFSDWHKERHGKTSGPETISLSLRALGMAAGAGLVGGSAVEPAADVLVPLALPIVVEDAERSDVFLPTIAIAPEVHFADDELSAPSGPAVLFSGKLARPHSAFCSFNISRQLDKQSSARAELVRLLRRAAGVAIFKAAVGGTGEAGAPEGLLDNVNVPVVDGTSIDHALTVSMLASLLSADAEFDSIRWLADPLSAEALMKCEIVAGQPRFVWDGGEILARPALASSLVSPGVLILGDWRAVVVRVWGGVEITVSPFGVTPESDFQRGYIGVRVAVSLDVALLEGGFMVATNIVASS
jgi:hypothetical protein